MCLATLLPVFSSHPSTTPSSFPLLPSSPQSHVCAPWFIPGSFWRGVPRRTEWGAGQPRRIRRGSHAVPADQRSSQRLLSQPHGEPRPTSSFMSGFDLLFRSNLPTVIAPLKRLINWLYVVSIGTVHSLYAYSCHVYIL